MGLEHTWPILPLRMRKKKRTANLTAKNYQFSCKKIFFSLNSYKLAAMHAVQTFQSNGLSRLNRGGSGLEFPKNKNKEGIYKFESIHFLKKNHFGWEVPMCSGSGYGGKVTSTLQNRSWFRTRFPMPIWDFDKERL